MASFVQEVQEGNVPSFTGASRGVDSDTSLERLFTGVGNAFESYTNTQDQLIKQDISQQASDAANQEAEGSARNLLDVYKDPTGEQVPSGVKAGTDRISRIQTAYEQGQLNDLDYYARMDSQIKRMKMRYPGYRDVIDAEVSSAMGSSLANDIRKEQLSLLREELSAAQAGKDDTEKRWQNFMNTQYVREAVFSVFGTADPEAKGLSRAEIEHGVGKYLADQAAVDRDIKSLPLLENNKKNQAEQAKQIGIRGINQIIGTAFRVTLGDGRVVEMQTAIDEVLKDGKVTPEEQKSLISGLQASELAGGLAVEDMLTKVPQGGGMSLAEMIPDKKDQDDMRNLFNSRMELFKKAIMTGDAALLKQASIFMDYRIDQQVLEFRTGPQGDALVQLEALRKTVGDELLKTVPSAIDIADELNKAVVESFKVKILTPPPEGGMTLGEQINRLDWSKVSDPATYRATLDTALKYLEQGEGDTFKQAAQNTYDKSGLEILDKFAPGNALGEFQKLASPSITKKIFESGDAELVKNYRRWVFNQFGRIVKYEVDGVARGIASNDVTEITFDGERFNSKQDVNNSRDLFAMGGMGGMSRPEHMTATQQSLNNINSFLQTIKPIVEASGGNLGQFVNEQFKFVDFTVQEKKGATGFLDALSDWWNKEEGGETVPTEGSSPRVGEDDDDESALDADEYLKKTLVVPSRTSDIENLHDNFSNALASMIQEAPPEIRKGIKILSGHRSIERQRVLWNKALRKYGSVAAARKWVAPPGKSQHNKGRAVDFTFMSNDAQRWVHENAKKHGLRFRMSHENWHIEPIA